MERPAFCQQEAGCWHAGSSWRHDAPCVTVTANVQLSHPSLNRNSPGAQTPRNVGGHTLRQGPKTCRGGSWGLSSPAHLFLSVSPRNRGEGTGGAPRAGRGAASEEGSAVWTFFPGRTCPEKGSVMASATLGHR